MLILIDESGDTGFKATSSRYFILTMVCFDGPDDDGRYGEAERTARVIKDVMATTRHKPEFHFTDCSQKVRRSFFHSLKEQNCTFSIYALVVDKGRVTGDTLRLSSSKFYNFFLKQLLSQSSVQGATIKIDGQKSKSFRRALQSYLRNESPDMIKKLRFNDSKTDVLIQLADMMCGAISYRYNQSGKLAPDIYMAMIGGRIKSITEFK